jgi:HD-GYP domain-containing protein (c-di-GMP phosphodiesterase class II)
MANMQLGEGDLLTRLNRLLEIGVSLSVEENPKVLIENILINAQELTCADGATFYSVTERNTLKFEMLRTNSLQYQWGGANQEEVPFSEIPLYSDSGVPNEKNIATYVALRGETVNIPDVYKAKGFDFSGTRKFDAMTGYRSSSMIAVPLKNHENEVVGVIQLLNAMNKGTNEVEMFSISDQHLVESLASQAAVALSNRKLISSLHNMLEGFVQTLASAIDEKSPHTGEHCRKVPIISDLLAQAINRSTIGPLGLVQFTDKELYELKIAALLHDCGKVATPTHVMDKSTRLEGLRDWIECIDHRFEILIRDTEINYLKECLKGKGKANEQVLEEQIRKIRVDQNFLHDCNSPSCFMTPEKIARIEEIGKEYKWERDGQELPFLNSLEIENLSIRSGTLNARERKIIEDHVVMSIHMLRSIPYPRHLQRVPEIAGAHHERLDGSGYPKGLVGSEMSIQAKILMIADVFEALTSANRPYRQPMKLSEVIDILKKEVSDGKLDRDLVDLFIKEKVHLQYACRFLKPEQIDV